MMQKLAKGKTAYNKPSAQQSADDLKLIETINNSVHREEHFTDVNRA